MIGETFQNFDAESVKKLYLGCSGCGKTTLMWRHFSRARATVKFIYDHKAMEFSRRYRLRPVFSYDGLMWALEKSLDAALDEENPRPGGLVVFSPMKLYSGQPEAGMEFFCNWLFTVAEQFPGKKLFGCDELQQLVTTSSRPRPLLTLCDVGRTYEIECYFIASATNAIHNLVRNQITEVFCFRHGDKNACEWEKDKGFDPGTLLRLKKYDFQWRNIDTGESAPNAQAFRAYSKAKRRR